MVKRITRLRVESGFLPKTRQIVPKLKAKWEMETKNKLGTGFPDPAMAPRGANPNPPPKAYPTAAQLIAASAKPPKNTVSNFQSEQQKFRALSAEMRRKYYADSLETMEAVERRKLDWRQRQFDEAKRKRLQISNSQESSATRLTLPTIESFLSEPFIVRRTPEEEEKLQLKREANRQATRIEAAERRAENLLEIYQKCEKYIVNEDDLVKHVEKEFSEEKKNDTEWESLLFNTNSWVMFNSKNHEESEKLKKLEKILTGYTTGGEPGLPEVQDALSGETQQYIDQLKKPPSEASEA